MIFPPQETWFNAVNDGDITTVTHMVQRSAKTMNKYGETALMCAVKNSDTALVATLVSHEAGCFHGKNGSTALMQAAARNMADITALLAPYEAKILARKRVSAAMIAAENNSVGSLYHLLPYYDGCVDEDGMNALDYAAQTNSYESAILLAGSGKHSPEQILAASNRASDRTATVLVLMSKAQSRESVETIDVMLKHNSLCGNYERMKGALSLLLGADYSNDKELVSIANLKREEIKKLQISILDREAELAALRKHYVMRLDEHEKSIEKELLSRTDTSNLATELCFYKNRYKDICNSSLFKHVYPNEEVTGAVCETVSADICYKHKRLESLVEELRQLKSMQERVASLTSSPICNFTSPFSNSSRNNLRDSLSIYDGTHEARRYSNCSELDNNTSPKVGLPYK